MAKLTFYGGVAEIGGNKILVEDRDARIWLDMGAPFDLGEEYFVEFLQPRDRFGLRDYFALDLVKQIPGLYSAEALDPTDMAWEPPAFSAIFITHVHYDHTQQLRFVDPNIPVHLGEGARTILESLDTTARAPFLKLGPHAYETFRSGQAQTVDGVEVEPIHVDHSAPAAYGYLVHTSEGTIAYTGDLRHHGPMKVLTEDFIAAAQWLQKHPNCNGKVGVVGFCYGGGMANTLAVRIPDEELGRIRTVADLRDTIARLLPPDAQIAI